MQAQPDKPATIFVRVPEDFRREVKAAAAREGVSLQEIVYNFLQRWLQERRAA
jgi:predicted HicB family RNase H-like nuclease